MRLLILCGVLGVGCGGSANQPDMAIALNFNGNWSGTLMHPDATCTDGSVKLAFSTTTSFQINQDQAGLFLIWTERCPVAGNIVFAVDAMGTARQQGDPAVCVNMSTAQATFSSGVMTVAGDALTLTVYEKENDTGTQTRFCDYPVTAMMTRQ
jgi:hypothetical protein